MSAELFAFALGAPSGAALTLGVQRLRKVRAQNAVPLNASPQGIGDARDEGAITERAALWQAQLTCYAFLNHRSAARQEQLVQHRKRLSGDDPWLEDLLERLEADDSKATSPSMGGRL